MWLKPSVNCLLILFPNLWDLLIIPMYVSFTFPTYVCNYKQCIFSMFLRFVLSNHALYLFLQIHFLSVLSLTFAQLLHTHHHVFLVYWFYCCIIVFVVICMIVTNFLFYSLLQLLLSCKQNYSDYSWTFHSCAHRCKFQ